MAFRGVLHVDTVRATAGWQSSSIVGVLLHGA
jgi:hypothetical protein